MANTTYKRMDYDQLLFFTNYVFQKLKTSSLSNNTTYTFAKSEDGKSIVVTGSDGSTETLGAFLISSDLTGYATESYVNTNGGKINTVSVNGTAQTITDKNVNITVPTKVSVLTNDSGYQTANQVSASISSALSGKIGVSVSIVTSAPTAAPASPATTFYIDLLANGASGSNIYTEYIWVNSTSKWEIVGQKDIDLSGYVKSSEMAVLSNAEITTAVDDAYTTVFG